MQEILRSAQNDESEKVNFSMESNQDRDHNKFVSFWQGKPIWRYSQLLKKILLHVGNL